MPRKTKQTAHAELDELRKQAAGERVKAHDVAAQLEAAKAKVEQASASITAGYAAEDQRAVARARNAEEQAVAQVRELQHRDDGGALRVERAQQQLDEYQCAHARDLLAEREQPARTVALELSRAVAAALRLHRAYLTERQTTDQLVAAEPGATPRADGPEGSHPWEPALGQLAPAYQQNITTRATATALAGTEAPQNAGQQCPPASTSAAQAIDRRRARRTRRDQPGARALNRESRGRVRCSSFGPQGCRVGLNSPSPPLIPHPGRGLRQLPRSPRRDASHTPAGTHTPAKFRARKTCLACKNAVSALHMRPGGLSDG